jgi:hypothetical protein
VRLLAGVVAVVLFALAALHVVWVARGRSASVAIPTRADGTPLFRPGPASTMLVAFALAVAGVLVLARASALNYAGARCVHAAVWGLAAMFALRTVGEFRYLGLFKRERTTPFARWDTWVFTPVCAALAAAMAVLAAS